MALFDKLPFDVNDKIFEQTQVSLALKWALQEIFSSDETYR